jgi:hypothetical protein
MFLRTLKRAAVAGAALSLAFSATAGADTQRQGHLAKDGSVWLVRSDAHVCKISTSKNLASSTCLNASLVRIENHGYTSGVNGLVNARLYYNQSWQNGGRSAYACISPQSVWTKGSGGVRVHFDQVNSSNTSGTGLNLPVWHDIARVQWTSARCV